MKRLALVVLAASAFFASTAFAQDSKDAGEARIAAERWMKLMDTEEYSAAWNSGAENLRKGVPKLAWNMLSSTIHMPLGAFKSRSFKSAEASAAASGKPASVTLEYLTDYENSRKVHEKFTAVREPDGVWRVSGYTLNSDDSKQAK